MAPPDLRSSEPEPRPEPVRAEAVPVESDAAAVSSPEESLPGVSETSDAPEPAVIRAPAPTGDTPESDAEYTPALSGDAETRRGSYDVPPSAEQRAEREVATIRRIETPYDTATVDVSR